MMKGGGAKVFGVGGIIKDHRPLPYKNTLIAEIYSFRPEKIDLINAAQNLGYLLLVLVSFF